MDAANPAAAGPSEELEGLPDLGYKAVARHDLPRRTVLGEYTGVVGAEVEIVAVGGLNHHTYSYSGTTGEWGAGHQLAVNGSTWSMPPLRPSSPRTVDGRVIWPATRE